MIVCGADTETTGLDPSIDEVIEIGAIKWEVDESNNWVEIERFSALMKHEGVNLSDKIISLTGITQELLDTEGQSKDSVIPAFEEFTKDCAMFIAHNAPFDHAMMNRYIEDRIPWVCTIRDIKHPPHVTGRKLAYMALDYGIAVDPSVLHRAVNDVELMGKILAHAGIHPQAMLEYRDIPTIYVAIDTPPPWEDNGEGKDFSKSIGFCFEGRDDWPKKFSKKWVKAIKECEVQELKDQVGGKYTLRKLS